MATREGTKVEIRLSDVDEMRQRAGQLFKEHWEEIALNKGVMKLSPNWRAYYELEERGVLVCLAALIDEELVGYAASFVYQHLHYSALTVIQNDVLFVAEEHRKSGLGRRLIRRTEQMVKALEAGEHKMALFHTKPGTAADKVLEGWGYGIQDNIRSKVIT
jgi:GNAT superfamily N-acetyltransferase